MKTPPRQVLVIGAGVAGASCARALVQWGCEVQVVDKSRGPGGRLASRRLQWRDEAGSEQIACADHGASGFAVVSPEFHRFLASNAPVGAWLPWRPTLAPGSRPLGEHQTLWVPSPDMPALCRAWLQDIPALWSTPVDRLHRQPSGWQVEAGGQMLQGRFDAVVLALPTPQTAHLLMPHRVEWAQRASLALMQPCWTLMGVSQLAADAPAWDLMRPEHGPLSWVMRHDARPGRERRRGEAVWVAHARSAWSRQHLEQPAEWVLAQLQSALNDGMGAPLNWLHAVVHRWRYAMPVSSAAAPAQNCWWDPSMGLGVCGDGLGGGGVEAAWSSAQALAKAILQPAQALPRMHRIPPWERRPLRAAT